MAELEAECREVAVGSVEEERKSGWARMMGGVLALCLLGHLELVGGERHLGMATRRVWGGCGKNHPRPHLCLHPSGFRSPVGFSTQSIIQTYS
jgi:hypothetical protein